MYCYAHLLLYYRQKRSFGQGNDFYTCLSFCSRGGGVCSNYSGGWGCLLQIFGGDVCSKFSGGVSAKNFGGGVCSKFSGGCLLQILGGVCSKFSGGVCSRGGFLQFSEYGHRSAGTHPTGMHSCCFN